MLKIKWEDEDVSTVRDYYKKITGCMTIEYEDDFIVGCDHVFYISRDELLGAGVPLAIVPIQPNPHFRPRKKKS
jgi:hypothetical protein